MSGNRDHEKRLDLGNISKIELTGFSSEFVREKLRMTRFCGVFGPSNWKPFIDTGNCRMITSVEAN